MNRIDLTGQRFDRLVVEDMEWTNGKGAALCRCDCGSLKRIPANRLRRGETQSCGCWQQEQYGKASRKDLTGQRFDRVVVVQMEWGKDQQDGSLRRKQTMAVCLCDCGRQVRIRASRLTAGRTRSCRCLERETHQARRLDLTGHRFGRLVVDHMEWVYRATYAVCQCDCGNEARVKATLLKCGDTNSCGCWQRDQTSKANREDLTGQRFERLVVQRMDWRGEYTQAWCICDCGQKKWVRAAALKKRQTKSCGCLHQEHMQIFGQARCNTREDKLRTKRLLHHARVARKRGLPNTFDRAAAVFMRDYWRDCCAVCGTSADFWHVIAWDHWIPLTRETCPGTTAGNILPLCHGRKGCGSLPGPRGCNNAKRNKEPIAWLTERLGARQAKRKLRAIETYFVAAIAAALQRTAADEEEKNVA